MLLIERQKGTLELRKKKTKLKVDQSMFVFWSVYQKTHSHSHLTFLADHQFLVDGHQVLVEDHRVHGSSHQSFVEGHQVLVESHQVHGGILQWYGKGHQVHAWGHKVHVKAEDQLVLTRGYPVHVGGHLTYRRKDQVQENHQTKHLHIQSQVLVVGHLVVTVHIDRLVLLRCHLENHLLYVKNLLVYVKVHAEGQDPLYFVGHQGDPLFPKEGPLQEGRLSLRDNPVVPTEDQ